MPPLRLMVLPWLLSLATVCSAAPLAHPILWVSEQERETVLEKIENHAWAKAFVGQFQELVDPHLKKHAADPASVLSLVQEIGADFQEHDKALRLARDAAMLFFLTQNEAYAEWRGVSA